MTERQIALLESLRKVLEEEHLDGVCMTYGAIKSHQLIVRFSCISTDKVKEKVKAIAARYEESMTLASEGKTVLKYYF